jgi:preprotein translocase subunit SecA
MQLLKAYMLFEKDVEYVVKDGRVLIVDEFTGRLLPGRRYSEGLHQAIEAKERVTIEGETQTLATITLQNYFRLYEKLAGMTGTAETEAPEFWQIYKLDVTVIPTNEAVRRVDYDDVIFRTRREKYNAVIEEIAEMHGKGRPVLVGTVSVEASETLSRLLKRRGIPHNVLNAKHHQMEAEIVAQAGQPGAVTIATNMAGRGTDIKLGQAVVKGRKCLIRSARGIGDCQVPSDVRECMDVMPCGLHIIGTERHEARRIDRQLRGRSGRQGDPGSSRFFLSLEDDLMRLFGSERIARIMDHLGVQEGEVIEHKMVTAAIGRAQKRVEAHNFDIRKHLLEYDDVMNQQREVIYDRRLHALETEDIRDEIRRIIREFVEARCDESLDPRGDGGDPKRLAGELEMAFLAPFPLSLVEEGARSAEEARERLVARALEVHERKEEELTPPLMRHLERNLYLRVIDECWKDHLYEIDQLKGGIGLRAYGQKDPLLEYKAEAYRMFVELQEQIREELFKGRPPQYPGLFHVVARPAAVEPPARRRPQVMTEVHEEVGAFSGPGAPEGGDEPEEAGGGRPPASPRGPAKPKTFRREEPKVGRNEPCPCGSGKKYKKCHGALQE